MGRRSHYGVRGKLETRPKQNKITKHAHAHSRILLIVLYARYRSKSTISVRR